MHFQGIKQILAKGKLTQKDIAERCHIQESTLSRYLNGKVNPKIETVYKIAKALHMNIDQLIHGKSK